MKITSRAKLHYKVNPAVGFECLYRPCSMEGIASPLDVLIGNGKNASSRACLQAEHERYAVVLCSENALIIIRDAPVLSEAL